MDSPPSPTSQQDSLPDASLRGVGMRQTSDHHGRLFSRKRFRDQSQAPNGYWRQLPNGRSRDLDSFDNPEEEEFFDVDMDDANPPLQADKVDTAKHISANDVDPTSTEVGLFVPYYKTLARGDFDDDDLE